MKKLLITTCAALSAICAAVADMAYTSASYVRSGLVAQWDGIDNTGTGTHDPAAASWKDLVGGNDMEIVSDGETPRASWVRGIGLSMDRHAAGTAAARANANITYKTIEIVFKEAGKNADSILLWAGNRSRYVILDGAADVSQGGFGRLPPAERPSGASLVAPYMAVYFNGYNGTSTTIPEQYYTPCAIVNPTLPSSIAATYDDAAPDSSQVKCVFHNGSERLSTHYNNYWNAGEGGKLTLGCRSSTTALANYGFSGEVYAIRLYDRVLTPAEIAFNHAIDVKRFFTSAMYDKTGMVSFWDAKDNAGAGLHDSSATTWKNLVAGGQDLTLNASGFSANALVCNGTLKSGAYGASTLSLDSLEILYRNERAGANAWLFSNGSDRYCIMAYRRTQWENYIGIRDMDYSQNGMHLLSWTSTGPKAYLDGANVKYTNDNTGGGNFDNWGYGDAYVQVGSRSNNSAVSFKGDIYSVRAYSGQLTSAKVWENSYLDAIRYANAATWNGGDGSFGDSANWHDADAAVLPGEKSTVNLPGGAYTIALGRDETVDAMRVVSANGVCGPAVDATFDMGGHSLAVRGTYSSDAAFGTNGNRFARLTLTNGAFSAKSVLVGALADRIPGDTPGSLKNSSWAFARGAGTLRVVGAGTSAAIAKDVTFEGPYTHLRVADGAAFSCGALKAYATGQTTGSEVERGLLEFTGAGTTATLGSLSVHRDVDFIVSDGASVTVSGAAETFAVSSSQSFSVSGIGRSYGGTSGNSSRVVVDDATLALKGQAFAVGASDGASGGAGSSFTLSNGATLDLRSGSGNISRFFVGMAAANVAYNAMNCVLNVLGGSTFDGPGTQIEVGLYGNSSFGGVNVSNATVNCAVLYLGGYANFICSSNAFLNVAGEAARIDITGTAITSMRMRTGSTLRFTLPENGFARTPITTAGGIYIDADDAANYHSDQVKIVIDATAFKGSSQTLIECAKDSTAAFQTLIANQTLIASVGRGKGQLLIADDGTKLVYVKPGMKIVIR